MEGIEISILRGGFYRPGFGVHHVLHPPAALRDEIASHTVARVVSHWDEWFDESIRTGCGEAQRTCDRMPP